MENLENVTVDLQFRASAEQGAQFVLQNSQLRSSPEFQEAFAFIFDAVASALKFEVVAMEPLPAVIPPIRRRWNPEETELIDENIAQDKDTLQVRWTANGPWNAEWRSLRSGAEILVGSAASGQPADYDRDTFVGPHERPAIDIQELFLGYTDGPTPSLTVSGRIRFAACPVPTRRPIRVHAHADSEVTLRQGAFETTLPIPPGNPETIDLTLLAGGNASPVTSGTVMRRIPTNLANAEVSVDEIDFSERLFAGQVPKRIRFPASGYAPRALTLEFRPTAGEAAPSLVHARKVDSTALHVQYYLELDKNTTLSFSESVPGTMLVRVVGQDNVAASMIELVPHLVRAAWEQLDAEVQLRVVSGELNVAAIVALGGVFDLRAPSGRAPSGVLQGRFRDPARVVTNVLLAGGLTIPLDDRAFTPAFARDASTLWNRAFNVETAAGTRFRLEQNNPDSQSLWDQVLSARDGQPVVLSLPGGSQALLSLPRRKSFGPRIIDAWSATKSANSFGVFFRGFCFVAGLEELRPSLHKGGLLLKLARPVHADLRTHPPVSTFLPLRALSAVDGDALAFWEPPGEPVVVRIENGLPVHGRVGYIYQAGKEMFWAQVREVDPSCKLKYVTFDGLVFSVNATGIDFEGWWLPDGRVRFEASAPFHPYSFDFTEGASSPYEFEVKDGVRCTAHARWLSEEAFQELQTAIAQFHETKPEQLKIGGQDIDIRWSQRDAERLILVTATKVVDSLEVALHALA